MPTLLESNELFNRLYYSVEPTIRSMKLDLGKEDYEDLIQDVYLYLWLECLSGVSNSDYQVILNRAIEASTLRDSDYDISDAEIPTLKPSRTIKSVSKEYIIPKTTIRFRQNRDRLV